MAELVRSQVIVFWMKEIESVQEIRVLSSIWMAWIDRSVATWAGHAWEEEIERVFLVGWLVGKRGGVPAVPQWGIAVLDAEKPGKSFGLGC